MYTPFNAAVYDAATASVAGFYSGQLITANAAWYVALADVWGQALDTAWGAGAYTASDLQNIRVCSIARFMNQGAGPNASESTPSADKYATDATEIVALVRGMTAQIVANGIDPNAGSGGGSTIVKLEQDIPLATLRGVGSASLGDFDIGAALPAGARVFPATAEIEVVQALATEGGPAVSQGIILGPNWPAPLQGWGMPLSAPSLAATRNSPQGGGSPAGTYAAGLNMTQGGNVLYCRIVLSGTMFAVLTAGHVKARILYTVLP